MSTPPAKRTADVPPTPSISSEGWGATITHRPVAEKACSTAEDCVTAGRLASPIRACRRRRGAERPCSDRPWVVELREAPADLLEIALAVMLPDVHGQVGD